VLRSQRHVSGLIMLVVYGLLRFSLRSNALSIDQLCETLFCILMSKRPTLSTPLRDKGSKSVKVPVDFDDVAVLNDDSSVVTSKPQSSDNSVIISGDRSVTESVMDANIVADSFVPEVPSVAVVGRSAEGSQLQQSRGAAHAHMAIASQRPCGEIADSGALPEHSYPMSPMGSPGKNRDRFMENCQPQRVCCNLNAVGLSAAGVRFSFQAVVFVVYPASDKPERRHVLLIDSTGCTGLTVWGAHVPLFNCATVGSVAKFTKLGMVHHNGKKALSMGRDTTAVFVSSTVVTEESKWWNSLVSQHVKRIIDIHDCDDDSVVNVAGIVGMLSSETKRVRSDNKDLMNMRLTDRTGWVDVRSWTHSEDEFKTFLEKPLLLQRVRVTSFSGLKICEIIDGNGTVVTSSFQGQRDLEQYWQE
jgi:hypothetical protein